MHHVVLLLNRLQQDTQQQYLAPEPPTLGDLNRPYMFYKDHQNLYYHEVYVEEPAYHGHDEYYQESQWEYEAFYQPSYEAYQPLEPAYQEPYHYEWKSSIDEFKAMLLQAEDIQNKLSAKMDRILDRMVNDWDNKIKALSSYGKELKTPVAQDVIVIERTLAATSLIMQELKMSKFRPL